MSEEKNISEKVKNIMAGIKEKTATTAYKLTIIKDSQPTIFESKFGGVPYWDMSREYPTDAEGDKMMLLAQINFTEAALEDERLPKEGLLQFFIASEDDVFGVDFDEPDSQRNYRIVFHEDVDMTVTKEQVLALNIPISTETNCEYSPVFKEASIDFFKTTAYMGTEDIKFDEVFAQVVKEQTGEELGDRSLFDYFNDEEADYVFEKLSNTGHWILGYPFYTQYDPRGYNGEDYAEYYNTLLFQMDSEMIDSEDYVLWGDCGVANFFINDEALKKKDFRKVLYNWDCY